MDLQQRIVVGLGNPGTRYQFHRHNIGFMVIDELCRRFQVALQHSAPEYAAVSFSTTDLSLALIKPLTYMNLSGEALARWAENVGTQLTGQSVPIACESVEEDPGTEPEVPGLRPLTICDDLALPLGAVRLRSKGSSGGQNGIQSVIDHLGGTEFPRLRLGISPLEAEVDPEFWPDFVLSDFESEEVGAVKDVIEHAADTVEFWLTHGVEATASRFNRRNPPQ